MSEPAQATPSAARAAILGAAARAFAERGFHGVTMRELARDTGRSLGAFYNHFASKEELLFVLQQGAFDELIASAERAIELAADEPADGLYLLILNHLRYIGAHPDVMRVLVHEAGALEGERRAAIRERKEAYFELARTLVAALVRGTDRLEIERATYSVFGMLNWTYGWYTPERHGPPEVLARTIHRVALGGVHGTPADDARCARLARRLDAQEAPPLIPLRRNP